MPDRWLLLVGTALAGSALISTHRACVQAVGGTAARLDASGVEHVPAFTWPLSELTSRSFKERYEKYVKSPFPLPPALTAPASEWTRFRADEDGAAEVSVAAALARHRVDVVETRIAGVDAAIISPKEGVAAHNRGRVLIYLHGGGFFMSRNLKSAMVGGIGVAAVGKIKVIALAYRQTPEFRYPAASEDVASVYRALLQDHQPGEIGIFGCSAGGVLTSQSVAWFQSHGLPRPGAVAVMCTAPMVRGNGPYLHAAGDSRFWGANGNFLGPWPAAETANAYFAGVRSDDAGAYPGSDDAVLAKFPPTLMVSGTRAVEMSPVVAAHAKFLSLGVHSSLYILEGGWHGAPLGSEGTPEGDAFIAYLGRWFDENLER